MDIHKLWFVLPEKVGLTHLRLEDEGYWRFATLYGEARLLEPSLLLRVLIFLRVQFVYEDFLQLASVDLDAVGDCLVAKPKGVNPMFG